MQGLSSRSRFDVTDAVPLGYVLVHRVAEDIGARALAIKGPVPGSYGLRTGHTSTDVDVLIAPADFQRFVSSLEYLGWTPIDDGGEGRAFRRHSITLKHDRWPVTIDAHERFPGFLRDAGEVFEALWKERGAPNIARHPIASTGPHGSALIMALHALRDPDRPASKSEIEQLAAVVGARSNGHVLASLAAETGAFQTASPFLQRIGCEIPDVPPALAAALDEWQRRQAIDRVRGIGWIRELQSAPWQRRAGIMWRAVITNNEATLRRYGMTNDGRRRTRAHLSRIRLLVRDAPHFARAVPQALRLFRGTSSGVATDEGPSRRRW